MITAGIIVRDDFSNLVWALNSLARQSFQPEGFEIIVVDNDSSREQKRLFHVWLKNWRGPSLRFYERNENNLGRARAQVVSNAKNNWVAFLDSDCQAEVNWLMELWACKSAMQEKNIAGVAGIAEFPLGNGAFSAARQQFQKLVWAHLKAPQVWIPDQNVEVSQLSTCNVLLSTRAVLAVGNFSEDFKEVCEDVDISLRLRNAGWRFFIEPKAQVLHFQRSGWANWIERMWRYGRGQANVLKTHGRWPLRLWVVLIGTLLGVFSCIWLPVLSSGLALMYGALLSFQIIKITRSPAIVFATLYFAVLTHVTYATGVLFGTISVGLSRIMFLQRRAIESHIK